MGMIDAGMFNVLKDMLKDQREEYKRREARHAEVMAALARIETARV